MDGAFSSYHPAVIFGYFAVVTVMTMLIMDPAFLAVSLAGALLCSQTLPAKSKKISLKVMLPVLIAVGAINPLFVHSGRTVIFRLFGAPITLESLIYGLCAAAMLAAVIIWFGCWSRVMGTDKFVALFAKRTPTAALLISMTVRLIPRFSRKVTEVTAAQRALGAYPEGGSAREKAARGIRVFSVLSGWALENSEQTADSMKARGYGLQGRTSYTGAVFSPRRDGTLAAVAALFAGICAVCCAAGGTGLVFYPSIRRSGAAPAFAAAMIAYAVLCALPALLEIRLALSWRASRKEMRRAGEPGPAPER